MKGDYIKLSDPKRAFLLDLLSYLEEMPDQRHIGLCCPSNEIGTEACKTCRSVMGMPHWEMECPCDYYGTKDAIKIAWITIDEELEDVSEQ